MLKWVWPPPDRFRRLLTKAPLSLLNDTLSKVCRESFILAGRGESHRTGLLPQLLSSIRVARNAVATFVQEAEIVAAARIAELARSIKELRRPARVLSHGATFLIKVPEVVAAAPIAALTYSIIELRRVRGIFRDTASFGVRRAEEMASHHVVRVARRVARLLIEHCGSLVVSRDRATELVIPPQLKTCVRVAARTRGLE